MTDDRYFHKHPDEENDTLATFNLFNLAHSDETYGFNKVQTHSSTRPSGSNFHSNFLGFHHSKIRNAFERFS